MGRFSRREMIAVAMLHKLYGATDGQAQQWRSLALIVQEAEDIDALIFAIKRQWIDFELGGRSVCLTEKGCRVALRHLMVNVRFAPPIGRSGGTGGRLRRADSVEKV